jgi:hypothetical protein
MTIEELGAYIGCLIYIKTELYWYRKNSWDGVVERFCILLDLRPSWDPQLSSASGEGGFENTVNLQLLIDDQPEWVLLNRDHFEVAK